MITAEDQENEHSMSLQRVFNFLCLAYGSPLRADFKDLADKWLPDARKDNCEIEYSTVKRAFDKTIMRGVEESATPASTQDSTQLVVQGVAGGNHLESRLGEMGLGQGAKNLVIVDERERNGPFRSVDDLERVLGRILRRRSPGPAPKGGADRTP